MSRTIYLVQSITECERCAGSGTIPNVDWAEVTCPVCRGQGYLDGDAVPLEVALQALGVNLVQLRRLLEVTQ